jgi:hypothetical protein
MILVAGLAVAGLVGIAAAFYFSVRPSGSRGRGAGPGRTGADRTSHPSAGSSARSARSTSPAARSTGQSVLTGPQDDPGHAAAARRTRHGASHAPARAPGLPAEPGTGRQAPSVLAPAPAVLAPAPAVPAPAPAVPAPAPTVPVAAMAAHGVNGTPGLPMAGSQPAALLADPADAGDAAQTPRSRRRVGWRKGAEVDQELWPTEAFGGVTDEQFWDDLAADVPLATTARIAQPDSASGSRPNSGLRSQPDSGLRSQPDSGLRSQPDSGLRSQPDSGLRSQPDSGPRGRPAGAVSPPDGRASLPGPRSDWTATQPAPIATRATRAARQPAESRGLPLAGTAGSAGSGVSADEDPLTSPAYSLRRRGAVDGRSYQSSRRSRDHSREQYEAATCGGYRSEPLRPDGYWSGSAGSPGSVGTIPTPAYRPSPGSADIVDYPYRGQSYGGSIQSINTPPFELYGYGTPAGLVGDPRRPHGARGHGQPGGGAGNWGSPYAYPPAAGYRDPYDQRGNDRR